MKKLILMAAVLVAMTATSALAEIKVEGSASVSVLNSYIWRGGDFTGKAADFVVQPSVTIGAAGLSVNFWSNINEDSGAMDETDLTIDYTKEVGPVALSVGNIMYNVDDGGAGAPLTTNEIYVAIAPTSLPVDAKLTYFYDYDEFEASYMTLFVGKSFDVADKTSLSLGAAAGYNDFDFLQNAELSASIAYALNDQVTITPSVLYSTPISDEADAALNDEVVAGVTVGLSF